MSADSDLIEDCQAAERRHREAKCKCRTKIQLVGRDGPSFTMLMAAWKLADALCAEYDAPADKIPEAVQKTHAALAAYRDARMPPQKTPSSGRDGR